MQKSESEKDREISAKFILGIAFWTRNVYNMAS